MRIAPDITRDSLFASAMSLPVSIAARFAGSPAAPEIAATRTSASVSSTKSTRPCASAYTFGRGPLDARDRLLELARRVGVGQRDGRRAISLGLLEEGFPAPVRPRVPRPSRLLPSCRPPGACSRRSSRSSPSVAFVSGAFYLGAVGARRGGNVPAGCDPRGGARFRGRRDLRSSSPVPRVRGRIASRRTNGQNPQFLNLSQFLAAILPSPVRVNPRR